MKNLFANEKIFSGDEKLGIKEFFLGMKESFSGMNKYRSSSNLAIIVKIVLSKNHFLSEFLKI
jgi:hypothetical protein